VPEEFDSKEEIFRLLDRICRPGTVLASNTSSLSVTEIAAVTERPQNVVGLHFASSEGEMSLIEVIRGAQTDDPTFEAAVSVGRRIGKETVAIRHASEMSRVAEP
jgi:3-hydroxybutyryl-CoA dehydrogenase